MRPTFIVLLACIIGSNSTFAQKKAEAPAAVKSAFSKSYVDATKVKWEKEDGKYEVSFNYKNQDMSVLYKTDGTVEETETKIGVSDLPAAAKKYASAKGNIKEAAKIVTANGTVQYEAEVNKKDLLFDEKGNFIKEQVEHDEKD